MLNPYRFLSPRQIARKSGSIHTQTRPEIFHPGKHRASKLPLTSAANTGQTDLLFFSFCKLILEPRKLLKTRKPMSPQPKPLVFGICNLEFYYLILALASASRSDQSDSSPRATLSLLADKSSDGLSLPKR